MGRAPPPYLDAPSLNCQTMIKAHLAHFKTPKNALLQGCVCLSKPDQDFLAESMPTDKELFSMGQTKCHIIQKQSRVT